MYLTTDECNVIATTLGLLLPDCREVFLTGEIIRATERVNEWINAPYRGVTGVDSSCGCYGTSTDTINEAITLYVYYHDKDDSSLTDDGMSFERTPYTYLKNRGIVHYGSM